MPKNIQELLSLKDFVSTYRAVLGKILCYSDLPNICSNASILLIVQSSLSVEYFTREYIIGQLI